MWDISFFINCILLGIGLSMDAFSVSLANGFNESKMKKGKVIIIALIFGFLQGLMPLIGWLCVHFFVKRFSSFQRFIPWIALILLVYIGGKMIYEFFESKNEEKQTKTKLGIGTILIQGIATSIDALSVGFTIVNHNFIMALVCVIIIMIITFGICLGGVLIGKKFGTKLAGKASLIGGIILVLIGIEIFIMGI